MLKSNYALTAYGVSFFEVAQYGIPTVVFSPYANDDELELAALKEYKISLVSSDYCAAVEGLVNLMKDNKLSGSIANTAKAKLKHKGAKTLTCEVTKILGVA